MRHRETRTLTVLVLTAALAAFALPSASAQGGKAAPKTSLRACTQVVTGRLRLAPKPRKCRRRERVVTWAIKGPAGPQGPKGDAGTQGVPGPSRSMFSAHVSAYVGPLSPAFAALTGVSQANSTESQVQTLSSSADFTASNLSVRTDTAPGAANSVTVTLRDDGVDTALTCTVTASATACTSPSAVLVGAGSALSLKVTSTPAVPATTLLVGLEGK